MRMRQILILAAVLLFTVTAWGGDSPKESGKRVVIVGDGAKWEWKGDPNVEAFKVDGVKRGFLGISMVSLTDDLRTYFGVADGLGVLVSEVVPDGPAAKAGLKGGDVIVSIDGKPIDGPNALGEYVRQRKGGEQVKIDVRRKGTSQQFFVTLDERDIRRVEVRVPEIERWIGDNGEGHMEIIELEEGQNEALDRMRIFFESPDFKTRVEELRGDCSEYQERLQQIEKRMKDLEKKLEKLK